MREEIFSGLSDRHTAPLTTACSLEMLAALIQWNQLELTDDQRL